MFLVEQEVCEGVTCITDVQGTEACISISMPSMSRGIDRERGSK